MKLKRIINLILYSFSFPRDFFFCLWHFGYWDKTWRLFGLPHIDIHRKSKLTIGSNFIACSKPSHNSIGVFQKVIIKAIVPNALITIGNNVGISGATISGSNITIGNNVLIGSGALITDRDAHSINPDFRNDPKYIFTKPIVIEDDVFIGARSIILKGVTLGRGSVVGAGAVVSRNVPEFAIVAGNPAKIVGNSKDPKYLMDIV